MTLRETDWRQDNDITRQEETAWHQNYSPAKQGSGKPTINRSLNGRTRASRQRPRGDRACNMVPRRCERIPGRAREFQGGAKGSREGRRIPGRARELQGGFGRMEGDKEEDKREGRQGPRAWGAECVVRRQRLISSIYLMRVGPFGCCEG